MRRAHLPPSLPPAPPKSFPPGRSLSPEGRVQLARAVPSSGRCVLTCQGAWQPELAGLSGCVSSRNCLAGCEDVRMATQRGSGMVEEKGQGQGGTGQMTSKVSFNPVIHREASDSHCLSPRQQPQPSWCQPQVGVAQSLCLSEQHRCRGAGAVPQPPHPVFCSQNVSRPSQTGLAPSLYPKSTSPILPAFCT